MCFIRRFRPALAKLGRREIGGVMKHYTYTTHGTCSRVIDFDLDENKRVHNVSFVGGCNGNLKSISSLSEGMEASVLRDKLSGITCGFKNTSCGDQFARALDEALGEAKA